MKIISEGNIRLRIGTASARVQSHIGSFFFEEITGSCAFVDKQAFFFLTTKI